ncbi:MAG: carbonic anhydrase [Humidesulfovibrio sp.]|nr:carbonic anhydrase [Humidesulfovibrio sp.]
MKKYFALLVLALALCGQALASPPASPLPADEALQLLKDGNARYASGQAVHGHQDAARRAETAKGGEHPVATILGCADSRAPLAMLFDLGAGDIFGIRVAGNVAGTEQLGSIEYGVNRLGTSVVLVLGHTGCDVVSDAVHDAKVQGNLQALINQIKPAVSKARAWTPTASGDELLNKSIKANVWLTMENILRKSAVVRDAVKNGQALLEGGVYDLATGKVEWLGQHPEQGRILASAVIVRRKPKPKPKVAEEPAAEQGDAKVDAAPEANAEAKPEAAVEAKPETKSEAKAEAKPGSKGSPRKRAKTHAKTAAKPAAKLAAKTAAKTAAQDEAANPTGHSEGQGELLAPESAPAQTETATPAKRTRK